MESGYLPVTTAANDMDAIRASGLELTDDYFEAWYQATLALFPCVKHLPYPLSVFSGRSALVLL